MAIKAVVIGWLLLRRGEGFFEDAVQEQDGERGENDETEELVS